MIKTYYGNRGSGKTFRLLKEAAKAVIDDYIVVIVCFSADYVPVLREKAAELFGDKIADKIITLPYNRVKDFMVGRDRDNIKVFIDESEIVLYRMLFGISNVDVSMTVDITDGLKLDRKDWDK